MTTIQKQLEKQQQRITTTTKNTNTRKQQQHGRTYRQQYNDNYINTQAIDKTLTKIFTS